MMRVYFRAKESLPSIRSASRDWVRQMESEKRKCSRNARKRSRSMSRKRNVIKDGDLVILYERHDSMTFEYVRKDAIYNNKFGAFHHNDMIGKLYGAKIHSRIGQGWMYMLMATPELWNTSLRHRTQIVFTSDASLISLYLELRPGSVVVESGTGSGALTTNFARTVAPTGHVYTFEFNETRARLAREDFAKNGMGDVVTVEHRDVCNKGFGTTLVEAANAIFLDLPSPWLAVGSAAKVLKGNGILCSYSPCIEQAQKTCQELANYGFKMLRTVETRLKTYDIRDNNLSKPDFDLPADTNLSAAGFVIKQQESGQEMNDLAAGQQRKSRRVLSKAVPIMRGHTAFLTFAVKSVQTE